MTDQLRTLKKLHCQQLSYIPLVSLNLCVWTLYVQRPLRCIVIVAAVMVCDARAGMHLVVLRTGRGRRRCASVCDRSYVASHVVASVHEKNEAEEGEED